MNDTFREFHAFLAENSEKIRSDLIMENHSPLRKIYQGVFRKNYLSYDTEMKPVSDVSSTDSSEFVRELYNGKKLILIRGYTLYRGEIFSSFIPRVQEVSREHVQAYLTMMMEHSEHLSLLKMIQTRSPKYILVDGSFSGRVMRRTAKLDADGFTGFRETYMRTMEELLEVAGKKGIPMIFISKSSESRKFRRSLVKELRIENPEMDVEKIPDSSDHYIVHSLAKRRGYTRPLKDIHASGTGSRTVIMTSHFVPDPYDLPLKVEFMDPRNLHVEDGDFGSISEDILNLVFWGYGSIKSHNVWLSEVDKFVKFRSAEMENVYMKAFEKYVGVEFYETRGERRARLRV
jgi:NurA-like 5'-3' nuclease